MEATHATPPTSRYNRKHNHHQKQQFPQRSRSSSAGVRHPPMAASQSAVEGAPAPRDHAQGPSLSLGEEWNHGTGHNTETSKCLKARYYRQILSHQTHIKCPEESQLRGRGGEGCCGQGRECGELALMRVGFQCGQMRKMWVLVLTVTYLENCTLKEGCSGKLHAMYIYPNEEAALCKNE